MKIKCLTLFWIFFLGNFIVLGFACTEPEEENIVTEDNENMNTNNNNNANENNTSFNLSWKIEDIDVVSASNSPGLQAKLLQAADGTLYNIYVKYNGNEPDCDIAIFGGGVQLGARFDLKVATKAPDDSSWSRTTVDLSGAGWTPYLTTRFGVDAVFDQNQQLVIVVAGGGSGQFTCGSSDLMRVTRSNTGIFSKQALVTGSESCCTEDASAPDMCEDPACVQGTDIGAWAAIAISDTNANEMSIAYADHHFLTDEDGQNFQGLEMWDSIRGVTGVRPWSGMGKYSAMVYSNGTPVIAYTTFNGSGLWVMRRPTFTGGGNDWQETNITSMFSNYKIGERIALKAAPNTNLGLAFHVRDVGNQVGVHDLIYCESENHGETWAGCEQVDDTSLRVGEHPGLAFDNESQPLLSYYYCGCTEESNNCPTDCEGVRLAWRLGSAWKYFDVYPDAGYYTQVEYLADKDVPVVIFQDPARGAAMAAVGQKQ